MSSRGARRIGCAAAGGGLGGPRIAFALLWLAGNAVQTAFQSAVFPLIGLLFLPLTALAYALAADPSGSVTRAAWTWPVIGFVADVAMLGFGTYWTVEYRLE